MAQNDGQSYREVRNSPTEKSKRRHSASKSKALAKKKQYASRIFNKKGKVNEQEKAHWENIEGGFKNK